MQLTVIAFNVAFFGDGRCWEQIQMEMVGDAYELFGRRWGDGD